MRESEQLNKRGSPTLRVGDAVILAFRFIAALSLFERLNGKQDDHCCG